MANDHEVEFYEIKTRVFHEINTPVFMRSKLVKAYLRSLIS